MCFLTEAAGNRDVPGDTVFIWFFAKLSIMHRHNISSFLDLGAFS